MELNDRLAQLSEAERQALRLYLRKSDPKEIGRALGRSPHTIDKYLLGARRKLGVQRSLDAAHLLAASEGDPVYGEVVYRPSAIAEEAATRANNGLSETGATLFPTRDRPWNALPRWARAAMILGGLAALAVIAVLSVDIAETLSRLDRQDATGGRASAVNDHDRDQAPRNHPGNAIDRP